MNFVMLSITFYCNHQQTVAVKLTVRICKKRADAGIANLRKMQKIHHIRHELFLIFSVAVGDKLVGMNQRSVSVEESLESICDDIMGVEGSQVLI